MWTKDDILKRYNDSFDEYDIQQKLSEETLNEVITKLITDEHVTRSTIEVYEYNP